MGVNEVLRGLQRKEGFSGKMLGIPGYKCLNPSRFLLPNRQHQRIAQIYSFGN